MENSNKLFENFETENIIKQVELKKELLEKSSNEERVYFTKRTLLLKDLIEILTCEIIARLELSKTNKRNIYFIFFVQRESAFITKSSIESRKYNIREQSPKGLTY